MDEDGYEPGQKAFCHEDGEVNEVEILENLSDKESIGYKLKVLSVEQESSMVKPLEIGEIFDCDKLREGGWGGLWSLLDFP